MPTNEFIGAEPPAALVWTFDRRPVGEAQGGGNGPLFGWEAENRFREMRCIVAADFSGFRSLAAMLVLAMALAVAAGARCRDGLAGPERRSVHQ